MAQLFSQLTKRLARLAQLRHRAWRRSRRRAVLRCGSLHEIVPLFGRPPAFAINLLDNRGGICTEIGER